MNVEKKIGPLSISFDSQYSHELRLESETGPACDIRCDGYCDMTITLNKKEVGELAKLLAEVHTDMTDMVHFKGMDVTQDEVKELYRKVFPNG